MSSETPPPSELLYEASVYTIGRLHSCLPGTVVDYDAATQTCSVQSSIALRRRDPDSDELEDREMPVIPNVPVLWPSGALFSFTAPLSKGDHVLIMVADRSIDEWKQTAAAVNVPQDVRRFNLSDAFVLPGGRPIAKPIPGSGHASGAVVLEADDIRLGGSSADDEVVTESRLLGELAKRDAIFNAHVHPVPGVTTGPGATTSSPTATGLSTPAAGSVSSPNVKAT